nr:PREDICTED: tetraspan membrane protein of hair cell stereocilia homolog [Lepisosteus oculatus]
MQPHTLEVARLYQTEFIRSARAVGALWAVCTLCFAVIEVVILIQPSWVGTGEVRYRPGQGGAPPLAGSLGLFEVCLDTDWLVPECRGSLGTLTPLPSFQTPAVLVCMSLALVWASVGCLALFRFCNAATVYKICAWLQLSAGEGAGPAGGGLPLRSGLLRSRAPEPAESTWLESLDGLSLAFVLGNRQDALLPQDSKQGPGLHLAS